MTLEMEIGGVRFKLNPAAISAIRYRAEYGESLLNDWAACESPEEAEGLLLRMCHCMIPEADRPELLDFAKLARRDPDFLQKALKARALLLKDDAKWHGKGGESDEEYDEYAIIALMAAARMDSGLIYELPIFHLVSIVGRYFEARDPDRETYHKLNEAEMRKLYP